MNWKRIKSSFKKKNKKHIMMLKDNTIYVTGNYIFNVCGDCEYDDENGSSIPYYWLVDLESERHYTNSTLCLSKNRYIYMNQRKYILTEPKKSCKKVKYHLIMFKD